MFLPPVPVVARDIALPPEIAIDIALDLDIDLIIGIMTVINLMSVLSMCIIMIGIDLASDRALALDIELEIVTVRVLVIVLDPALDIALALDIDVVMSLGLALVSIRILSMIIIRLIRRLLLRIRHIVFLLANIIIEIALAPIGRRLISSVTNASARTQGGDHCACIPRRPILAITVLRNSNPLKPEHQPLNHIGTTETR
ncbi:hypothetical protein N9L19_00445 [bacterium]|nr:hypothetical protein [bacterium]